MTHFMVKRLKEQKLSNVSAEAFQTRLFVLRVALGDLEPLSHSSFDGSGGIKAARKRSRTTLQSQSMG